VNRIAAPGNTPCRITIAVDEVLRFMITHASFATKRPCSARWCQALFVGVMLALAPLVGGAHEPDAEELALMALVDADLAASRTAHEQSAAGDHPAAQSQWKPAQAGVARSYDMGYTVGPVTTQEATHASAIRHGVYFSAWRKNAGGAWRMTLGVRAVTPAAVDFAIFGAAPRPQYHGAPDARAARQKLLRLESAVYTTALSPRASGSAPLSYASLLALDVELFRDGEAPVIGAAAVAADRGASRSRIAWSPVDAHVSQAADMAMTHGTVREYRHDSIAHSGYYVHLWLRDAAGRWRLAYDIAPAGHVMTLE